MHWGWFAFTILTIAQVSSYNLETGGSSTLKPPLTPSGRLNGATSNSYFGMKLYLSKADTGQSSDHKYVFF